MSNQCLRLFSISITRAHEFVSILSVPAFVQIHYLFDCFLCVSLCYLSLVYINML